MKNDLLSQNGKMRHSSQRIFNFGIPAYKSRTGFVTCPMASACIKGCYANQGAYQFGTVKNAYERRLMATMREDFAQVMESEIIRRKVGTVRIHDSGDFYSPEYARKWFAIAKALPTVQFYAYTKRVSLFKAFAKAGEVPANLRIIFSFGGLEDGLINTETDVHSRVFASHEEMTAAGYADTTEDDAQALTHSKVGLVYHGAPSKAWAA